PRLVSILVLGRAADARPYLPPWGSARIGWFSVGLRTLVTAGMLYVGFQSGYQRWQDTHGGPPLPVTGRWEVVSMRLNDKDGDKSDPNTWTAIDFTNKALVRTFSSKPPNLVYRANWSVSENKLALNKLLPPASTAEFTYTLSESDKFELRGTLDGK